MFSCGQSAGRSWPLLLAVALAALWAAPAQAEDYGLYVCGVRVTDANKNDLTVIPGVTEGTVTYDRATSTLRLKDAVIEAGDNSCIYNTGVSWLTVEVEGKCKMESQRWGIVSDVATVIRGKSGAGVRSLVVSTEGTGVYAGTDDYSAFTITDVDLTITSQGKGIFCGFRPLTIRNSTVRVTGEEGSISQFSSITLDGCMLLTPEGAAFEDRALKKDGALVTGEAVIGREYDLRICGVQVTDMNKDDLSAIAGVTGTAIYNPYANVLRLKDAAIVATGDNRCIENAGVAGLAVEVEGACTMESGTDGIAMDASTVIRGKSGAEAPTLSVVSGNTGIRMRAATSCTISDLGLTAEGSVYGIAGKDGVSGTLAIENATVRAKGGQGSIRDFSSVTLKGCLVLTPENAAFDGGTLKKDGKVVAGEAVIVPGETYGLKVCGVPVTDVNKDDLSAIPGVTGSVTYDPSAKTLRLKDARIEAAGDNDCIKNESVDGLTVEVEGKCAMTSDAGYGFVMGASTTIAGKDWITGKFEWTITSSLIVSGNVGIDVRSVHCTINGLDLTATGQEYGIAGGGGGVLEIEKATVRAKGTKGSICNFNWVRYLFCKVLAPMGAAFGSFGDGTLKKDGEVVTEEAIISLWYFLDVCGVLVTDANKDDLSAIPGVKEGTVTFDPATWTLRLKDAVIEAGDNSCFAGEGLTFEVEGKCKLTSAKTGIELQANSTITGKAGTIAPSLSVFAGECGIKFVDVPEAITTIRDLDLTATGQTYGIFGENRPLTIENATVRATGGQGSICNFKSVELKDCQVLTPAGAAFDGGTLKQDGEAVTGEAVIGRSYGLYICGVPVTDANKDDLSSIPGVTGTVTYDPATKTLRLKDAAIEATDNLHCIVNGNVDGLTVEVEGQCAMTSSYNPSILLDASTVIAGKPEAEAPSLSVYSWDRGILVENGASCTVRDLDLTAKLLPYGITGNKKSETLTIENATVRAMGSVGAICNFASVTLKDCHVVTPAGAAFDGGALIKDGRFVTEEVLILPTSVGIGTTAVDAPRREGTYTLSGVRLTAPLDQLPRGVYVVDGQKVVKK